MDYESINQICEFVDETTLQKKRIVDAVHGLLCHASFLIEHCGNRRRPKHEASAILMCCWRYAFAIENSDLLRDVQELYNTMRKDDD